MSDMKEDFLEKDTAVDSAENEKPEAATTVQDTNIEDIKEQNTDNSHKEEVTEPIADNPKEESMADFNIVSLHKGQKVKGKIIRVTDDELIVNVEYKSDGIVSKDEILLEEDKPLSEVFHEGDEIEVEVVQVNDGEGNVILSQKKLAKDQAWKYIEDAYRTGIEVIGTAKEVVKGGLLANIKGFSAFVPASQLSLRYVPDLNTFIGQKLRLKILEIDKKRNRAVASQKAILEAEEAEKKRQVWENIQEGQRLTGEVKRLTNFGAFVDIGGVDGLIHISDLSWGHIKSPKQVVSEGQKVEVVVLSVDKENNKISLGYKQTLPHPWDNIEQKYPAGQIFQGKVVRITTFGAFVELEPGVDGLVHISQISDKRINKVEDVLKTGNIVSVKVLEVKPEEKRISLSIKEAAPKQEEPQKEEEESPFIKEEMTVSLSEFFPDQNKTE
ncbi:MAG TPA: 30S ribosomal protein S1 [Clostridiales bacterium]|nr:30S ribosomal protein S1 [Clostridiales bacterium]